MDITSYSTFFSRERVGLLQLLEARIIASGTYKSTFFKQDPVKYLIAKNFYELFFLLKSYRNLTEILRFRAATPLNFCHKEVKDFKR